MTRPVVLSLALLTTLAACTPQTPPETTPPPAAETEPSCGADKLVRYVGSQASDEVVAAIRKASGAQTIRVVGPDTAVTMDFRPDRLNVSTDANGVIKAFHCS